MSKPKSRSRPAASYSEKPPAPAPSTSTSPSPRKNPKPDFAHAAPVASSHFELREDGEISAPPGLRGEQVPQLIFHEPNRGIRLYHGNSLEILDAIAARHPDGWFDCIFADPPYFLSNGGITCHAGRMVKVDKGDWDKSRGPELNHEFNREWLRRCQAVLKPNGTIWVTGTMHVIFSIGYAMQQLGFKLLNDIAWEKPNPPPNLSCRYFTHSTETILWAAKNEKSKHVFNYAAMKAVTGKQMKTVWRGLDEGGWLMDDGKEPEVSGPSTINSQPSTSSVWTMSASGRDEKQHGKHPTQKPVALIERCLLAATNEGDLVLDPFMGAGTTAVACLRLRRHFVGIELDPRHFALAQTRADHETIQLWLRAFRVEISVSVLSWTAVARRRGEQPDEPPRHKDTKTGGASVPASRSDPQPLTINSQQFLQIDLDLNPRSMDRIRWMEETPPKTDCIFHEVKFVFLSCAQVSEASVVHTTVDVNLQEAWAKTPNGKKRETTHVVRCETEIFQIKSTGNRATA